MVMCFKRAGRGDRRNLTSMILNTFDITNFDFLAFDFPTLEFSAFYKVGRLVGGCAETLHLTGQVKICFYRLLSYARWPKNHFC